MADTFALGEDPTGGFYAHGYLDGDFEEADELRRRLDWIDQHVKGGHIVWWYRRDTGDGILLDDYQYMVAFNGPADDAAFVAAFPEAAR